mmetsp:Transcript_11752/g.21125  ORF Transcript_11752/g.21125 Transcript_11752/m.21125 type:complete len:88 (+) Transcript_11752:844-1107(+)
MAKVDIIMKHSNIKTMRRDDNKTAIKPCLDSLLSTIIILPPLLPYLLLFIPPFIPSENLTTPHGKGLSNIFTKAGMSFDNTSSMDWI